MKKILLLLACSSLFLGACGAGDDSADGAALTEAKLAQTAAFTQPAPTYAAAQGNATGAEVIEETAACSFTADQANSTAEAMNYFVFRQTNETYTDESGRELLVESLVIPEFYSADPELREWVNGTVSAIYDSDAAFGQSLISFAGKEVGNENFYTYSNYVTMGIARHDSRVASLLSQSSAYSGGAHPNSLQTAYNLDLANRRVLKLEDVISENGADELIELVQMDIENRFFLLGEDALFSDYAQTISNALSYGSMTSYWYFTEEGMVVFFNQYELGPYTSGIIRADLPYEKLDGILLPEYLPPAHTGAVKDAYMTQVPDEDDWIYYVDLTEGETVYVSLDGKADHVQFSEVFWAGRTVVGESMLFSANQVSDGTTFAVTGDLSDPAKIYAVEYYDSSGGPYVLYVYQGNAYKELPETE